MFAFLYAIIGLVIVVVSVAKDKPECIIYGLIFLICAEIRNVYYRLTKNE